jgi:hypothetical protein
MSSYICRLLTLAVDSAYQSDMYHQLGSTIMSNNGTTCGHNKIQRPTSLGNGQFIGHTTHAEIDALRKFQFQKCRGRSRRHFEKEP